MDLFDLLILAALALPAIFRWISERSRKGEPGPLPSTTPEKQERPSGETDFERALREISTALGGKEPSEPDFDVVEDAREAPVVPDPPRKGDSAERGGFSREEAFERETAESRRRAAALPFKRLKLRRIRAPEIEVIGSASPAPTSAVSQMLRGAKSARDAIVASEILGRPLALRESPPDERE